MITANEARDLIEQVGHEPILNEIEQCIKMACERGQRSILWMATNVSENIRNEIIKYLTNKCRYYVVEEEYQLPSMKNWYTIKW